MSWAIQEAGRRFQVFDRDQQRTLEGVAFVRRDRAERVRRELEANDLDDVAEQCLTLARKRSSEGM